MLVASRTLTDSEQRLVKIIRFTQFAIVLAALSYLVEAVMNVTSLMTTSLMVWMSALFLVEITIRCVYSGKQALGFSIFLTVITLSLFLSMWSRGGLVSTGVVCIPVFILLSVLYGQLRDVLGLLISVILFILFLQYSPLVDESNVSPVLYQIPIVMIVICVGAYVCWSIASDMRIAFTSLHKETTTLSDSQEAIRQLSKTDYLTGLWNTKQASVNYAALLKRLTPSEQIYFYFIDLDDFKEINDLFDHQAGDKVLVLIAERLKALGGETTNVCRLSGDEFVIFYAQTRDHDASVFAQHLVDEISKPHQLFGATAHITASVGVAVTRSHVFNDIRKKSSMAMYQAKRDTQHAFYLYSQDLENQYMSRLYIMQGLERAIEDDLLTLHFQPKVDLKTQQINGMESLIRWTRGNPRGYTPDEFMSVIESTELIHKIGSWVITESCAACKKWHDAGHILPVAVNVSAQQLYRPDFAEQIKHALSQHGLQGMCLEMELTERFFIEPNESVEAQLEALRQVGVNLTIDDFGTGYSNVNYLMDLEATTLKLDKSFVDRLHSKSSMSSIIRAIIDIARSSQVKVVAEGIETEADVQAITELGCDVGQGYYWSKPLELEAAISSLNEGVST